MSESHATLTITFPEGETVTYRIFPGVEISHETYPPFVWGGKNLWGTQGQPSYLNLRAVLNPDENGTYLTTTTPEENK